MVNKMSLNHFFFNIVIIIENIMITIHCSYFKYNYNNTNTNNNMK